MPMSRGPSGAPSSWKTTMAAIVSMKLALKLVLPRTTTDRFSANATSAPNTSTGTSEGSRDVTASAAALTNAAPATAMQNHVRRRSTRMSPGDTSTVTGGEGRTPNELSARLPPAATGTAGKDQCRERSCERGNAGKTPLHVEPPFAVCLPYAPLFRCGGSAPLGSSGLARGPAHFVRIDACAYLLPTAHQFFT